ncbi:minor capsid protein [Thermomonospora cellulosilytica]|uniref:HK97 gp10 family phage protein n=1 Tax=Thermomonospora cellulosilytica TaxID=1411118 RepID=A0A7W3R8M1_9ACTN|nr:minor capsid protein [Thermomonospora cellulosilytica]MBA9003734.1 hypothetical protein [Thermomonospora cellulosilytica]
MTVRMTWNGPQVQAAEREAAERGVALAAEHLLGASRQRVPLEEGTLERSGVASTDGLEGAVSYDTVYAVRQHEELTWRHDPGRTAKYLEGPLEEESAVMLEIVAAQIRRALRS